MWTIIHPKRSEAVTKPDYDQNTQTPRKQLASINSQTPRKELASKNADDGDKDWDDIMTIDDGGMLYYLEDIDTENVPLLRNPSLEGH